MSHSQDFKLSKALSYLLRHGAVKEGLKIDGEGLVEVSEILNHRLIGSNYNLSDIERIVNCNDKQRFKLIKQNGKTFIKANQGHSIKEVDSLNLKQITQASEAPTVIHGTYLKNWNSIKVNGLSRMKRNHIHFARGLPKDREVISGMRRSCEVYIYIDIDKALSEGIEFYQSENGVILSPGNSQGILNKKYFKGVVNSKTATNLSVE